MADTIVDIAHSNLINRDDVREDLVKLVSHTDCGVRSEAMGALAYHGVTIQWESEMGRRLLGNLLHAIEADADSDCRRAAAGALGSFFRATRHEDVLQTLARVCMKPDETPDVRGFAYVAFLDVAGVPKHQQPSPVGLDVGPRELGEIAARLGTSEAPRA
jgi:hypothetical protein